VELIVNAQTVDCMREEELAELIRTGRLPGECRVQVFNFFTDTPLRLIVEFLDAHGIAPAELLAYYRRHVRELYPNRELEEMLTP
jgi:hypothetical protein